MARHPGGEAVKFVIHGEQELKRALHAVLNLSLQEHGWIVMIRPYSPTRSSEQNNRHWLILTQISDQFRDETGKQYSPETFHEYFKALFLGKDTIILDGQPILVSRTTTKLNTIEFSEFDLKIEVWASEHGIHLTFEEMA